jgi:hypothetical protein
MVLSFPKDPPIDEGPGRTQRSPDAVRRHNTATSFIILYTRLASRVSTTYFAEPEIAVNTGALHCSSPLMAVSGTPLDLSYDPIAQSPLDDAWLG